MKTLKEIVRQLEDLHAELLTNIEMRMVEEVSKNLQEMIGDMTQHGPRFNDSIKELCEAATAIIVGFSQIEGVITRDMATDKAPALAGLEPTIDDLDFDEEPQCDSGCERCNCESSAIYEKDE
jgi:hypothetical protein